MVPLRNHIIFLLRKTVFPVNSLVTFVQEFKENVHATAFGTETIFANLRHYDSVGLGASLDDFVISCKYQRKVKQYFNQWTLE